jgi:D-aspartate ligase
MLAVVLGRFDLVRALGLGGIRSVVVAERGDPIRHSRYVDSLIAQDSLLAGVPSGDGRPPLFYDSDAALDHVARERERLGRAYSFVLPEPDLLADLVDKERFQELAKRRGLRVPRASRARADAEAVELRYPVVLKASPHRDGRWAELAGASKVLRVDDEATLRELAARLDGSRIDLLAQELVPGGEERIESYHVYVDSAGEVAAEFTGRKVRTEPREFGMTTSLETTDEPDVVAAGRDVVDRIGFRGVAKLDFKRAPDGTLHLLEINPRFTLWAHAGAIAGVNIPAVVYADLTGRPRPAAARARAGVRWLWPSADLRAAREAGVPLRTWLRWALGADANSAFALTDPAPLVARRLRKARGR